MFSLLRYTIKLSTTAFNQELLLYNFVIVFIVEEQKLF